MTRWTVHFIWAGLLVSIVALSRAETSAESTTTDDAKPKAEFPAQMKIGVVDMKKIASGYKVYIAKMEALQVKGKEAQAKFYGQQAEINKLTEKQKDATTPAEERLELQRKITEQQSMMTAEASIQQQKLIMEQNEVQADMVESIERKIAEYSKRHGLHLVLRAGPDKPNRADRAEVNFSFYKSTFYYDPAIDITEEITKTLNEQ
jgi:Skp family chaperone for outer membrane proteins